MAIGKGGIDLFRYLKDALQGRGKQVYVKDDELKGPVPSKDEKKTI